MHTTFESILNEKQIELSDRQRQQFETYFKLLVEWNEKINLTAITDREQVYLKHFYDSVSLSFFYSLADVATIADIGAGAGFPSVPLKIVYPHLKVTILDSLQKRISFLNLLTDELGLSHVTTIHARAEDAGRNPELRDRFDLVTARAVARLPVLNEFCLPFAKKDGRFIAMKGSDPTEELRDSRRSLHELRGELVTVHEMKLPIEHSMRHLIEIRKTGQTPAKYPRKAGTPLKAPLM